MWNPVFNLAVHWLKLVYRGELILCLCACTPCACVCASRYGSLWAVWVLHREEEGCRRGQIKKKMDQDAKGADDRCVWGAAEPWRQSCVCVRALANIHSGSSEGGAGRASGKVVIWDLDPSCVACPGQSCDVRLKGFCFVSAWCIYTYTILFAYCVLYTSSINVDDKHKNQKHRLFLFVCHVHLDYS